MINKKLYNKLITLYKQAFSTDTSACIENFFSGIAPDDAFYITGNKGAIISSGYTIRKPARFFGLDHIYYLSALATDLEYRGKGLIGEIIKKCFDSLYERGEFMCVLYPFSHTYYKRFGFENISFCKKENIIGKKSFATRDLCSAKELTDSELCRLLEIEKAFVSKADNCLTNTKETIISRIENICSDNGTLTLVYDGDIMFAYALHSSLGIEHYATTSMDKFRHIESLKGSEFYNFEKDEEPYLQARIFDIKRALSQYDGYLVDKKVVVKVTDSFLDKNNVTLLIDCVGGRASVTDTNLPCDHEYSIENLTILLTYGDGEFFSKRNNFFIDKY